MHGYRRSSRWVATVAAAALLAFACGDDDNPASSSGNASVPDHPGANTPITSSNARQVMTEVSVALNGALGRVLSAAASKPAGSGAAKSVLNQTASVNNKTVNGLRSGKVTINNGTFGTGSDGTQTLKADLVFDDFSDDGQIFMGGTVNIDLSMKLPTSIDPNNPTGAIGGISLSFKQKGDLAFSGKYKGTLKMDLDVSLSGGQASVKGSVTVGGNTVNL